MSASSAPLRIGELATRSGVSVRSLRYYESRGLLTSERTPGGQREYHEADAVDRVILIQELLAAGLTTAVIVTLLPCVYSGTTTREMVDRLVDEREEIDRRVREMAATRDRLDDLLVTARSRIGRASAA